DRADPRGGPFARPEGGACLRGEPAPARLYQRARLVKTARLLRARRVDVAPPLADARVRAATPALGTEIVAREVRGDREQPRPDVRVLIQAFPRPICAQERLLAQVVGVARAGRDTRQISINLRVMRRDNGLERLEPHTLVRHRCHPHVKTDGLRDLSVALT